MQCWPGAVAARPGPGEQTLDLQLDALKAAGCAKVYQETASGAKAERPVLGEVLSYLRKGDTLVVWRFDLLGRSLQHLIEVVAQLAARGIGFKSLTEQIDTTTPGRKLIFHVFGALAESERDLIRLARTLYAGGQTDITTICRTLGISRATLDRSLNAKHDRSSQQLETAAAERR